MDQVEEIKQRLDVAEVVGSYVQLKQSGRNLKAPCPFHHEKTASFMVSPEKGIWHCFGCGEGGDIYKFVMKMEGLDFRGSLELLAARAGIELQSSPKDQAASKLKKRLQEANRWAVKYFQASLVKNPRALEYLIKQRNLKRQTVQDFEIGFAPDNWEGLTKILIKKGFTPDELLAAGLAGRKHSVYDLFRGRIMLPICDAQGAPVGFTGRVLGDDMPKYLNTPQTPLYDKSRAIYGIHLAKEAIRAKDEVVLVEGNLDVIASHQAGIKQVVAASGTALTLDQLKTLSRLTKNIKLAFDQDAAGLTATERAIELGQKLGLSLKMVQIDGAKDPDELIQKDPKLWQKAIDEAKYIVDYLFDRFETQFDLTSALGKRQFSDRLATNLKRLADAVEQDHYINLLAEKTGVSAEAVKAKVEQSDISKTPAGTVQKPAVEPEQNELLHRTGAEILEESVLSINLAYPETRLSLDDLSETDFDSASRQKIFKALTVADKKPAAEIAKDLQDDGDYAKILTLRGEEEFNSLAPADRSLEAFRLARRLQTTANKKSKVQITRQLREAEQAGDAQLVKSLLAKYQALIAED